MLVPNVLNTNVLYETTSCDVWAPYSDDHRSDVQVRPMDIPTFLRKKSCSNPPLATHETYQARAALRVLRLIVNGKGFRSFIGKEGFKDDDIPRLIGLESHSDVEVSMKEGQQLLKARLSELEGKSHKPDLLDP